MKRPRKPSLPESRRRRPRPRSESLVLAGDIGGTKTTLGIFRLAARRALEPVREETFPSRDFQALEPILEKFLGAERPRFSAAAFAIAGPVLDNRVETTNLPWHVDGAAVARGLGCRHVRLLNDLEGTAIGSMRVAAAEIQVLQAGVDRVGNRAVIAAGTGLGQGVLFWNGSRHVAVATEGGHTEFGPRDALQERLLAYLTKTYPDHVSYERIVSGPGLVNIFNFLSEAEGLPVEAELRSRLASGDAAAAIGSAAIEGRSPIATSAVDLLVSIYGAQAGNLALTVMAVGGVYLGGGIVTKVLSRVVAGGFLEAFRAKGRYAALMSQIPVRIILNPRAALLGAAHAAAELVVPGRH